MAMLIGVLIFLLLYFPAIIALISGLKQLKETPDNAKGLLIFAVVYFIIGFGICGSMMS